MARDEIEVIDITRVVDGQIGLAGETTVIA